MWWWSSTPSKNFPFLSRSLTLSYITVQALLCECWGAGHKKIKHLEKSGYHLAACGRKQHPPLRPAAHDRDLPHHGEDQLAMHCDSRKRARSKQLYSEQQVFPLSLSLMDHLQDRHPDQGVPSFGVDLSPLTPLLQRCTREGLWRSWTPKMSFYSRTLQKSLRKGRRKFAAWPVPCIPHTATSTARPLAGSCRWCDQFKVHILVEEKGLRLAAPFRLRCSFGGLDEGRPLSQPLPKFGIKRQGLVQENGSDCARGGPSADQAGLRWGFINH